MIDKTELESELLEMIDSATTWGERCAYKKVLDVIRTKHA